MKSFDKLSLNFSIKIEHVNLDVRNEKIPTDSRQLYIKLVFNCLVCDIYYKLDKNGSNAIHHSDKYVSHLS